MHTCTCQAEKERLQRQHAELLKAVEAAVHSKVLEWSASPRHSKVLEWSASPSHNKVACATSPPDISANGSGMYLCSCPYTCLHKHLRITIRARTKTCLHKCLSTCVCARLYTCLHLCPRTCICARLYACLCTYMDMHVFIRLPTRMSVCKVLPWLRLQTSWHRHRYWRSGPLKAQPVRSTRTLRHGPKTGGWHDEGWFRTLCRQVDAKLLGSAVCVLRARTCGPEFETGLCRFYSLYIFSILASPTACPLRGYWRDGTQK